MPIGSTCGVEASPDASSRTGARTWPLGTRHRIPSSTTPNGVLEPLFPASRDSELCLPLQLPMVFNFSSRPPPPPSAPSYSRQPSDTHDCVLSAPQTAAICSHQGHRVAAHDMTPPLPPPPPPVDAETGMSSRARASTYACACRACVYRYVRNVPLPPSNTHTHTRRLASARLPLYV